MLMNFFRRKAVMLLTVLGISAPFIGMKMVGFYYYSSIIGCAAGFLCCILALIIVMKRSAKDNKEGKA
ncbi:hypothetical protein UM89_02575 [Bacillus subtilis]|uniref:Uncharacterized protein n=1 Tax=Bacillus cabrialesii subsp. tritici TaxID=2944916 RepID=A0ABT9DJ76_9BACI|nr:MULTISPECIES: hypothetical protein [Bacillus]KJJ43043.1 hypothetical protein UM89_02575 [Bacillus subtilis]MDO8224739.1 hypothetical protein [Bacillus cabrialesii subsp. tritici]OBA09406.1 hypothetical protein A9D36_18850 [Bacillus subtilis]UQE80444.1 hypothetical protein EFK13_07715 [Bacillus cabrialesii]